MPPRLSLSLIAAPEAVRPETREVDAFEFTLGRGSDVDWCLLDPDRNILSRRHCVLLREDDGWWIEDRSGNGTFLNQNPSPIGSGGKKLLRDGDRFRLGPYEFQVSFAGAVTAPFPEVGDDEHWPAGPARPGPGPVTPPFGSDRDPEWGRVTATGPSRGPRSPFGDDPDPVPPPAARPAAGGNPFANAADPAPDWPPAETGSADDAWPPRVTTPPVTPPRAAPPSAPGARSSPFVDDTDPAAAETGEPSQWRTPPASADPWPPTAGVTTRDPNPHVPPAGGDRPANPFAQPGEPNSARIKAPVIPPAPPRPAAPAAAAQPTQAVPAAPPAAAAPASAGASAERLVAILLDAAGLPDARPHDAEQMMRIVGEACRAMVHGVREVQEVRREVRGGFRISRTSFTQNPFKVAISDDDAMEALLGTRRGAMPAGLAVAEILAEIVQHEMATMAAMQEAARALADRLSPDRLRAQAEQAGGLAVLPAQRKARAWDLYEAEHARVVAALRDDFDSVFGKAFALAYERVVSEGKA